MGSCYSSIGKRYKGATVAAGGGVGGVAGPATTIIPASSRFLFGGPENELHRIPDRMFVNGASNLAALFTQQGKKGTNQDAMLVWEVSLPPSIPHRLLFSIFPPSFSLLFRLRVWQLSYANLLGGCPLLLG